jgi:hypothetical protein
MGWASMSEDIQERSDEAEYRRNPPVYMREQTPQLASVAMREPPPRPVSIGEVRVGWMRSREGFTLVRLARSSGRATIGACDRNGEPGAIQLKFEVASEGVDTARARLSVEIGPEDFGTVIRTMVLADQGAALDAMKRELRRHAGT